MAPGISIVAVLAMLGLVVVIRLAAGGFDRDRVTQYIESRGGRILGTRWTPFGPGWFGERSDRIYEVRYVDAEGNERIAHCKTSLTTGVYFTEDRIVRQADRTRGAAEEQSAPEVVSLREENHRLRQEIERLRREPR